MARRCESTYNGGHGRMFGTNTPYGKSELRGSLFNPDKKEKAKEKTEEKKEQ